MEMDTSFEGMLQMMGASALELAEYEKWKSELTPRQRIEILRRQNVPEAIIMRDNAEDYFPPEPSVG